MAIADTAVSISFGTLALLMYFPMGIGTSLQPKAKPAASLFIVRSLCSAHRP